MALRDLNPWDRRMAIAGALLLAAYLVVAVFAGASPSSDPQQGMAEGFIVFVGVVLLAFAGLLWLGVARNHPWIVRVVFVLAAYPAIAKAAELVYVGLHRGA
jgi:predicted small integral membrane protein